MGQKALTPTVTQKRTVADRTGEETAGDIGRFGGHRGALCPLLGGGLRTIRRFFGYTGASFELGLLPLITQIGVPIIRKDIE